MRLKSKLLFSFSFRDKIIFVILLVCLFSKLMFNYINKNIVNPVEVYAENEIKNTCTFIINNALLDINEDDIMKLFDTINNSDNEIVSVNFNSYLINKSLVKLNKSIYSDLKKVEEGAFDFGSGIVSDGFVYKIPLGLITNNYVLSNVGPKIPLKAKVASSVISNIKTEVSSYGINNSLLKVYIDVTVNMRFIIPLITKEVKVNNSVPLVVKIINGKIPNVYGGSYAVTSPITSSN